jgi:hypothetical protein
MVTSMLDVSFDMTLDLPHAAAVGAAVEVNLRLATIAVVEVDLTSGALAAGALEVHLRLAAGPDLRRALEVTHRRAWPAADMRGIAMVDVSLVAISGAGLGHREAEGHSGHQGGACG